MRSAIRQILFAETPFSPSRLFAAGQQGVWYDVSDFSTMFQDSAGTTPVTAIDQPVGRILDKSGRGNHASQSTTTSRPILRQDVSGRYFLEFDGTDDWLQTSNIDFTLTAKVSAFAGVRKISDANIGTIIELSAASGTNPGTFMLTSSGQASAGAKYGSVLRGTLLIYSDSPANYPAPITNVVTLLNDIDQTAAAFEQVMRINTSPITLTTIGSTAATGIFGNYPLYIGRRNGATLPFNGRIYSLIICGYLTSGAQLTNTETWVNSKTGAY